MRTHKAALRQIALRQRTHLLRLRARQRAAQREIEEKSKDMYDSKFCHLCRLHYRLPKAKHQLSEHHKTMKKFLMPYCSICHLAFKSPMLYETHRCSLEHIRVNISYIYTFTYKHSNCYCFGGVFFFLLLLYIFRIKLVNKDLIRMMIVF